VEGDSEPMVLGYTAHAAPMQMVFYTNGSFPAEYNGDAFVTMRGSWNRKPASGYEIVRVRFERGQPTSFEPFVTGFLTDNGTTHIARPMGLAIARDGSLLMVDDANGVIYRVAYGDNKVAAAFPVPPSCPMLQQAVAGSGVPLAIERDETEARGSLEVSSPSIAPEEPIPDIHSAYKEGVSPALSWSAVVGAKSYAIIMENPDSKPLTPFVHWVAWNIPGTVTRLPEGLPTQPRLTEPEGILQGTTSRGSVGYYGPRPPVGDPPHRYHFQVFALDTMLDLSPGATRDALLKAVSGHVLAKGELIGTYGQTEKPLK
jgi:Raf kinase inhibitor-like YbhB/YbcL family protein